MLGWHQKQHKKLPFQCSAIVHTIFFHRSPEWKKTDGYSRNEMNTIQKNFWWSKETTIWIRNLIAVCSLAIKFVCANCFSQFWKVSWLFCVISFFCVRKQTYAKFSHWYRCRCCDRNLGTFCSIEEIKTPLHNPKLYWNSWLTFLSF